MNLNAFIFSTAAEEWFPVGITDGRVVDGQLNASSSNYYSTPQLARVNFDGYKSVSSNQGCWRPTAYKNTEWLSVDLMVKHEIGELVIQGHPTTAYFLKQYLISYSDDGINYSFYKGTGKDTKVGRNLNNLNSCLMSFCLSF